MQSSTILLIALIGAIFIMLVMCIYIFAFERKRNYILWLVGWADVALNYALDAFFPDVLRGNGLVLLMSLSSYFYANLLIAYGVLSVIKVRAGKRPFLSCQPFGYPVSFLSP